MYQIDNSTAAAAQPASTVAGSPGFFTDGNPATATPATIVPAEWLNSVMMELVNVVTGAGLTPTKNQFNQVLTAIKRLGQSTVILADTGIANAYTATNSPPLVSATWVDGVVQQVKIAHANTGASTYAPDGLPAIPIYGLGLQPLQNGELSVGAPAILMRATIPGVNAGNPICILMECAGGPSQVAPATQSGHAVQLGQLSQPGIVLGRLLNVQVFTSSATYTPASGTTHVRVRCIGGGGGGGGTPATGAGQASSAGGGAAGSFAEGYFANSVSQTVTVGAGGSSSAGGSGTSGGASSFGSLISCPGGGGGAAGSAGSTFPIFGSIGGNPGAVPTGTGANMVSSAGSEGGYGLLLASGVGTGGNAGSSQFGAGGVHSVGTAGNGASGRGAGGSGASAFASQAAFAGGAGSAGIVIVEEYM